ncbi:MAG: ABC transporter permease subunit [Actinobacteria bacterium]|nr:ABC transporter permease subunit [Actinomycetota bacterium]NBY16051.1 ABC transporter permease subunit [Actinomycetota bacterium]
MVGLVARILFLGLIDSLAFWAGTHLVVSSNWLALTWLVITTVIINIVYLAKRTKASRWLLPGTILLVIFQIYPVLFTAVAAFSNYSTEHFVSRDEARKAVLLSYVQQVEDSPEYPIRAIHKGKEFGLLIVNPETEKVYLGTEDAATEIPSPKFDSDGLPLPPADWNVYSDDQINSSESIQNSLTDFASPISKDTYIKGDTYPVGYEYSTTVIYDAKKDQLIDTTTGYVFKEVEGAFVAEDGTSLTPGWRVNVGFKNFHSVITDPVVRGPFVRVLIWTFVYAFLTVITTFILGLTLALILNHPGVKGRKFLRSSLIIPYAMPGFLSLLIWAGFLNDDFGVINNLLGTNIPWLTDAFWAKVSTVLVNLWLGFPYMFLICTGAIQSIPAELAEAASVDGAKPRQILTRIKLPLLMVTVSPLLIGSFAYNFNNFGGIYLLTGGGPPAADSEIAGSTDILISYTYKLAIESGHGNDYGLACAISILIFFIVAGISTLSFTRTRALETLN